MNRLKEKYLNEVVPSLKEKYNYKSIMEVPKLEKIVINMGVGDALADQKYLDAAVKDLEALSGQKAVVTTAKKSIAGSFEKKSRIFSRIRFSILIFIGLNVSLGVFFVSSLISIYAEWNME